MYLRVRRTFNEKKINWENILPWSTRYPFVKAHSARLVRRQKRKDSWDGSRISIRKTHRGALQLLLVDHNLERTINLFSAMHLSSTRKSRNNLRAAHKFAAARTFSPGYPLYPWWKWTTFGKTMLLFEVAFTRHTFSRNVEVTCKFLASTFNIQQFPSLAFNAQNSSSFPLTIY